MPLTSGHCWKKHKHGEGQVEERKSRKPSGDMEDKLIERWLSGGAVEGKFREEKGVWLQWGIQINRSKNKKQVEAS